MAKRGTLSGIILALSVFVVPSRFASAEGFQEIQNRRPDLFHEHTGFRIARHRAPVPEDIPAPAHAIGPAKAADLLAAGAVAIDVSGALQSRFDELEGTWLVRGPRQSLPGAVWLPEVGRGVLEPEMQDYLTGNLERLTGADKSRAIVVFCIADCWMSWNAAQRIAALDYENVFWFRDGTDGWADHGNELAPALPVPVNVD